jgi:hypothetical protein
MTPDPATVAASLELQRVGGYETDDELIASLIDTADMDAKFHKALALVERYGEPYTEHEKRIMLKAFRLGWCWAQCDKD